MTIPIDEAIGPDCLIQSPGSINAPHPIHKQSGPIASSIGIVIGALLMILIAVSYGALVERFPVSGGAFAFSYLSFGRYVSFFSSYVRLMRHNLQQLISSIKHQ
jgi:amino acid transporter